MCSAEMLILFSYLQRASRESPSKRFCEDGVEVFDECEDTFFEFVAGCEAGPFQQAAREY